MNILEKIIRERIEKLLDEHDKIIEDFIAEDNRKRSRPGSAIDIATIGKLPNETLVELATIGAQVKMLGSLVDQGVEHE